MHAKKMTNDHAIHVTTLLDATISLFEEGVKRKCKFIFFPRFHPKFGTRCV